jgi:hypothetical protein
MEDLLDQYLALDWNACGPIQSKQFFRICAPGTQKTPFFQYLSMALSSTCPRFNSSQYDFWFLSDLSNCSYSTLPQILDGEVCGRAKKVVE